jgi:tRNA(Ile2) C34 agmatinyltransferase TiaS
MLQKKSCRTCGTKMTTVTVCGVCKEDISWRCSRCTRMEAIIHVHNYKRAVDEEVTASSRKSHLSFGTSLMRSAKVLGD